MADRNHARMKKYLNEHPICERCKKMKSEETHHIIPLSIGGLDEPENYIALCTACHYDFHKEKYSKSKLSQFGIYKRRYSRVNDLISIVDLYHVLNSYEDRIDFRDFLDIVGNLPSYGSASEDLMNEHYDDISDWLQNISEGNVFDRSYTKPECLTDNYSEYHDSPNSIEGHEVCGTVNKGKTYKVRKAERAKEIIRKHSKSFGGTLGNKELMKLAGITEPTLLKYKKEIKQKMTNKGACR